MHVPSLAPLLAGAFIAAVMVGTGLRLWLASRQIAAVRSHRAAVPAAFASRITLPDHQKAADYTLATVKFGRWSVLIEAAVTLALTVGGAIGLFDELWQRTGLSPLWRGALVILTVTCVTALIDLPLSIIRTFRIEARFGFNRTTPKLFVLDLLKGCLLALLLGGPITLGALTLMNHAGRLWWLWAWGAWLALMLVMTWAYPTLIAPLFNKFTPLGDAGLKERITALLQRCGFKSEGVFVVDGSRRSSHGNAYFTGIGRQKRIVFFDTLLERLSHQEIEAVLAHELGHFKLHHVRKRLWVSMAAAFFALALLGWLTAEPAFYSAFGVPTPSAHAALLLFMFVTPAFSFFATPLGALWSRRHEYEADAFAAQQSSAGDLAVALVKLYRDNATTLTPDSVYSSFYYSHPVATERIARLTRDGVEIDRLPDSFDGPVRA